VANLGEPWRTLANPDGKLKGLFKVAYPEVVNNVQLKLQRDMCPGILVFGNVCRSARVRQGPPGSARVRQGPPGSARVRQGPPGSARVRQGPPATIKAYTFKHTECLLFPGPFAPVANGAISLSTCLFPDPCRQTPKVDFLSKKPKNLRSEKK
jgi:hypothetical protein